MAISGDRVDLKRLKDEIFQDLPRLLDSLDVEYRSDEDNIFMCCPAHPGSDNPNGCSLSIKHRVWHCWTHNCHDHFGKDIFGFVKGAMQTEDFSAVLRHLKRLYSFSKDTNTNSKRAEDEIECDITKVSNIFKKRTQLTVHSIDNDIPTCGRSKYFESRGFLPSTLKHFGVEDCEDFKSPMKNRAIIPIYQHGVLVGFIARSTRQHITPKYLFSQSFKKTDYLYNYDEAIAVGTVKNALFVLEGQGDVWRMYENGVKNCVGIFGKSISDQQERLLLQSGITNLIILTDSDSSGQECKVEIKRKLGRMFKLFFPKVSGKDVGTMFPEQIQSKILSGMKGFY